MATTNAKAMDRLASVAAAQFTSLNSEVEELGKSCTHDVLERQVEELLGQLVSLAQKLR